MFPQAMHKERRVIGSIEVVVPIFEGISVRMWLAGQVMHKTIGMNAKEAATDAFAYADAWIAEDKRKKAE